MYRLSDSCVAPATVDDIYELVEAAARANMTVSIGRGPIESVLNTIMALEQGQGLETPSNTEEYYRLVSQYSGAPLYVVSQVVPVYQKYLNAGEASKTTRETREGPQQVDPAPPIPAKKRNWFAISGIFGALAILATFIVKGRS